MNVIVKEFEKMKIGTRLKFFNIINFAKLFSKNISQNILRVKFLFAVMFMIFTLTACDKAGIQGGDLKDKFNGVETVKAISPTSVQLEWTLDPRYSSYNIYKQGQSVAVKSETFSKTMVSGLTPNTAYSFTVTGVEVDSSKEEGFSVTGSATTLSNFTGIKTENVSVVNSGRIDIKFIPQSDDVTYEVYKIVQGSTWSFTTPADKQLGSYVKENGLSVTGLSGGVTYCFYVLAKYEDGTSEPTTTDTSYINANSACGTTTNNMPSLPEVTMNDIIPGLYPWFDVQNGLATYSTSIYNASNNALVATINGAGQVRSSAPIAQGQQEFYAIIKGSNEQAKVSVKTLPDGNGEKRVKPHFRSLVSSGSKGPIYPELIGGGKGSQKFGQKIVQGDFNCDGLKDVAISAPEATPMVDTQHRSKMGAVYVYYSYRPTIIDNGIERPGPPQLKTDVTPSSSAVFPNAQLIYYPPENTDMKLGSQLAVGNVNADCVYIDPATKASTKNKCDTLYTTYSADVNNIFSCDDLAASAVDGNGSVFVVFGNSTNGLASGSGSTNYGLNEFTCDAYNFNCLPVKLTSTNTNFGRAIIFGDYNNDGFDDLAVSSRNGNNAEVFVLRGSASGLYPIDSSGSFPKISPSTAIFGTTAVSPYGFTWANDVGRSLATVYDSRYCYNSSRPAVSPEYDFTKCDDLVIGAPSSQSSKGSIYSCIAKQDVNAGAGNALLGTIANWYCQEHYPTDSNRGAYGWSLLGVKNLNSYPQGSGRTNTNANIAGALLVGAPNSTANSLSNAGRVYAYYVTPQIANIVDGGFKQGHGGIQALLNYRTSSGNNTLTHAMDADNQVPCDLENDNVDRSAATYYSLFKSALVTETNLKHCYHQVLYPTPSASNAKFGYSLSVIDDLAVGPGSANRGLPSIAIGAPEKNLLNSAGNKTISKSGAVYVYKLDNSLIFAEDSPYGPKREPYIQTAPHFASGINPFGPSLVYPLDLTDNSYFGMGGVVGSDFNGDESGDILAAGESFYYSSIPDHGSAFVFYGKNQALDPQVNTIGKQITDNLSKELNYNFEMAKVVGDINGDGFADVVTRSITGDKVTTVLFYGSSSGLVTSPAPSRTATGSNPLIVALDSDRMMGEMFYKIGSVNGDSFDDILLIGKNAAYVYYGSFSGLVVGAEPAIAPIGSNPHMFGVGGTYPVNTSTLKSSTASEDLSNAYKLSNESVAYEDFNGDGYTDIAIARKADVLVVYGSNVGLQVKRSDGSVDAQATPPCTSGNCASKSLVIDSFTSTAISALPSPITNDKHGVLVLGSASEIRLYTGSDSGLDITYNQVSQGVTMLTAAGFVDDDDFADILMFDSSTNAVKVYYGRQNGSRYDIEAAKTQSLTFSSTPSSDKYGYGIASAGDFNQDGYDDILINVPNGNYNQDVILSGTGYVILAFGGKNGIRETSRPPTLTPKCYGHTNLNSMCEPYQIYLPDRTEKEYTYISSSSVGDINGDGVKDVLIGGLGRNHPSGLAYSTGVLYVLY